MLKQRLLVIVVGLSIILPLLQSQPAQAQDEPAWLLTQINALRGQLGLHAYVWNGSLTAAAQEQSNYMANTGHISHTQTNGSTPASRAAAHGYGGRFVSENIYGGSIAQASDAWTWWLNSPVHYAGIAHNRNNEIGIAVGSGTHGNFYTLVFGYNSGVSAPPASGGGAPAGNTGGESSGNTNVSNPAPTNAPPVYVPPTITPTPTATIPTQTPTITWTPTATWTPSPTITEVPETSTPIQLPTAAVVIAQVPTDSANSEPPAVVQQSTPDNSRQALAGSAGQPPDENADGDAGLLALLLGGLAVLGIGLLFMGYGIYNMGRPETNPTKE